MRTDIKIIGFPDHEGVQNVGGRIGAGKGPFSFETFFKKLNGDKKFQELKNQINHIDFEGLNLEEKHQKVVEIISKTTQDNSPTIAVGGGHDFIYSYTKGIAQNKKVSVINIDPHLDMRPYKECFTSGSPFRRLINEDVLDTQNLVEYGIQTQANAPELFSYAEENSVDIVNYSKISEQNFIQLFEAKLNKLSESSDEVILSLDLDMIQAAFAPGVSAPAVEGFSPEQVRKLIEKAHEFPKVKHLGIFELNPVLDIDDRTARLAAYLAYHFIMNLDGDKDI